MWVSFVCWNMPCFGGWFFFFLLMQMTVLKWTALWCPWYQLPPRPAESFPQRNGSERKSLSTATGWSSRVTGVSDFSDVKSSSEKWQWNTHSSTIPQSQNNCCLVTGFCSCGVNARFICHCYSPLDSLLYLKSLMFHFRGHKENRCRTTESGKSYQSTLYLLVNRNLFHSLLV